MVVAGKYAEFSFFSQSSIICKKGNAGQIFKESAACIIFRWKYATNT